MLKSKKYYIFNFELENIHYIFYQLDSKYTVYKNSARCILALRDEICKLVYPRTRFGLNQLLRIRNYIELN